MFWARKYHVEPRRNICGPENVTWNRGETFLCPGKHNFFGMTSFQHRQSKNMLLALKTTIFYALRVPSLHRWKPAQKGAIIFTMLRLFMQLPFWAMPLYGVFMLNRIDFELRFLHLFPHACIICAFPSECCRCQPRTRLGGGPRDQQCCADSKLSCSFAFRSHAICLRIGS